MRKSSPLTHPLSSSLFSSTLVFGIVSIVTYSSHRDMRFIDSTPALPVRSIIISPGGA